MSAIVITVFGGVVDFITDDPDLEVMVIDWDDMKAGNEPPMLYIGEDDELIALLAKSPATFRIGEDYYIAVGKKPKGKKPK
jgi:hypothetical protein